MAYLQLAFFICLTSLSKVYSSSSNQCCASFEAHQISGSLIAEGQALDGGILFHAASMGGKRLKAFDPGFAETKTQYQDRRHHNYGQWAESGISHTSFSLLQA